MGKAEVREPHGREQQELDGALDGFVGELDGRRARWAAAVVDEDVDPSEGLDRRLDQALEVLRVRQVAPDRQGAEPLCLSFQEVAATGEHGDVCAFGRESFCDREPHPRRGAADDGRATAEPEIHATRGAPFY